MKNVILIAVLFSSTFANAAECYRYKPKPAEQRTDGHSPTLVAESYLQSKSAEDLQLLKNIVTEGPYREKVVIVGKAVSNGCPVQIAQLYFENNWGTLYSLSSFKKTTLSGETNRVCTYFGASDELPYITCKM